MHHVYAYGVIAASTLVEIGDAFPPEGGYAEIRTVRRSMGGEAAGSAFVLARLGVPTKLAGSKLGTGDDASWVVERLTAAGVDCRDVATEAGAGVTEWVVSSSSHRTIFATYASMLQEGAWRGPNRDDVRSSRMVCLDPFFRGASSRVAEWCLEDGVPYVTVDVSPDSDIAVNAEAVVVAEEYAARTFDGLDAGAVMAAYADRCRGLVVLTRGSRSVWYQRRSGALRQSQAFDVEVRDTAGAGDAFRAGVVYGLLREMPDHDVIRTASAVAAMVCQTSPGVLHCPTEAELGAFLADAANGSVE
jgi:sugar/nucleoside kinase (ribokinase family)